MFMGHYAPALALKGRFPDIPAWHLFLAVQAVDVLFFALVPIGVEHLSIDSSQPGSLALVLGYMPFSHSLVATLLWALVPVLALRSREGIALGLAVASHWFLDLPMHVHDLPILTGEGLRVGFGLWRHPIAAWAFEIGLLVAAAWPLARRWQAVCALLVVVQTLQTLVVPLPTSVPALAAMSEASYLAFAALAWWVERQGMPAARPATSDR